MFIEDMKAIKFKEKKKPIKKANDREAAYKTIQELILSMHIKPGETVTETSLSHQIGIGRTPVREALKILEQEGLIVTHNRRKRVYILTVKEIEDIFDLKICIESAVVKWATENRTKEDGEKLKSLVAKMKQLSAMKVEDESDEKKRLEEWLRTDNELHSTLFKMADNKRAEQIIKNLNTQWHRLRVGIYTMEGRMERAVGEHERFIQAIVRGEATAAESNMRVHLENLKKELVKILKMFHFPYS
jgi:GntR family transcriptional regulator, rspAB operon transcriptional repressor